MASSSGGEWKANSRVMVSLLLCLCWAFTMVSAENHLKGSGSEESESVHRFGSFLRPPPRSKYLPVWPPLNLDWRELLGFAIGFIGAAFVSVGGVGGGAIFVPMLTVVIGFDVKSATAISKCMITGIAGATVFYKLKMRHPTLDMPIIDYDLALLFQPMLLLGITIGVYLNVIFSDWMIILILVILSLGTAIRALFIGFDTWKKETLIMQETAADSLSEGGDFVVANKPLLNGSNTTAEEDIRIAAEAEVPFHDNIHWKEFSILVSVWLIFLVIQITKHNVPTCSIQYWVLNFLQIPVAAGVTLYESVSLYKGKRVIASRAEQDISWSIPQLVLYCVFSIFAGVVGGLLGLGGSFILAPLLLKLRIPPQVSSATATFVMAFSSSLSVVQYYLLERFPVSCAVHFVAVATIAALVGQHLVRKVILVLGRASLIIFIPALLIFVSAVSIGVHGVINLLLSIRSGNYIGFEDRCLY